MLGLKSVVAACLAVLFVSVPAWAGIDTYEFDTKDDRERYGKFIDELRCPKCKNQNLAGSNAPIAQDLRRELYRLIEEEQSDDDIVDFMVDRYGDFVLYRPPLQKNTYALWYGTAGMLFLGVLILVIVVSRRNRTPVQHGGLTDGEQERLSEFLTETKAQDSAQKTNKAKKKK